MDEDDPLLVVLAASELSIQSTVNRLKCYTMGQLIFIRDVIRSIRHKAYWVLIHQQKQTQVNKGNICKNIKRVGPEYKVGDKVMLNNKSV